jgi:hypothetical protein
MTNKPYLNNYQTKLVVMQELQYMGDLLQSGTACIISLDRHCGTSWVRDHPHQWRGCRQGRFLCNNTTLALRAILSDNLLKQAQNNAVVVQQENMDRVGVEPTTSALYRLLRRRLWEKNSPVQIPPGPLSC